MLTYFMTAAQLDYPERRGLMRANGTSHRRPHLRK